MKTIALITATPEELPASERLSDTVLDNIKQSTKIDSFILLIARYGDYAKVEEWAIKNSIEYVIGDEDSVIDRINRALIMHEADVLVRLMLRACWVDYELVDLSISQLIQTNSDYVQYGLNINYAMGADCFTKDAYLKACELIQNLESAAQQSTYKLNPWAIFENTDDFKVHTIHTFKIYPEKKVDALRLKLNKIFGDKQNHLPSSHLKPAARYLQVESLLETNKIVAEISCGQGGGAAYLSKHCISYDAYDISEEYINKAKEQYIDFPVNYILGGEEVIREKADHYDVIISLHTMEHVPDESSFLEAIYNSLKPGGTFICEVPRLFQIPLMKPLFPFHEKEYTLSDLIHVSLKSNFSLHKAFGVSRNIYTKVSRAREAIMLVLKK